MLNSCHQLLEWCKTNEIDISEQLSLGYSNETGLFVRSNSAFIPANQTLVRIPSAAILSVRSSPLAKEIPKETHGIRAQLALSCALYAELLNGERSRWFGYLQSLPKNLDLPYFWKDSEALGWLRGTRAEKLLWSTETERLIQQEVWDYYSDVAQNILSSHFPAESISLAGFCYAFSLVSSRSFLVDAYHSLSMVPIADAFNHISENHVHLESDFDVCTLCGSVQECTHDREDMAKGSPALEMIPTATATAIYEMVSNVVIPPQTEVFNTYGENLSDADLLVSYGFILEDNDKNRFTWDTKTIDSMGLAPSDRHDLPEEVVVESNLVYFHQSEESRYGIDAEGKISHYLWLACVPVDIDVASLWEAQLMLEHEAELIRDVHKSALAHVAKTIVQLCQCTKIGSKTIQEANEALDHLSNTLSIQRLAITYFITESSILASCCASWQEFWEEQLKA